MKETPISVLAKQIGIYETFLKKLETKDNINPEATQEDLDSLIALAKEKIKKFQSAIDTLSPKQDWKAIAKEALKATEDKIKK